METVRRILNFDRAQLQSICPRITLAVQTYYPSDVSAGNIQRCTTGGDGQQCTTGDGDTLRTNNWIDKSRCDPTWDDF